MKGKEACKAALRERFGLNAEFSMPLLGAVCRITQQKGIDLLLDIGDEIAQIPSQLVVLGTGDRGLEAALAGLAQRHPGQFSVRIGFDDALAHLVEAGADIFLMPSRFEPCGLNQMYSLRYGTPPLVRNTGGLADTVVDCDAASLAAGSANGFVFEEATSQALLDGIRRAAVAWRDKPLWHRLQRNGMALDFSWSRAADAYKDVYAGLAAGAAKKKAAAGARSAAASRERRKRPGGS